MKELNLINMLSEKYKQIIEDMAFELQNILNVTEPQNYNINEIENFLKSANCSIEYLEKGTPECAKNTAYFDNKRNVIFLNCPKEDVVPSEKNSVIYTKNYLKVLFHEIWHFMSRELDLVSEKFKNPTSKESYSDEFPKSISEMSANYFSRAMLMPKEVFIKKVAEYTASSGVCNVFELAKFFCVEFADVIARGKDLNLWNMKVGV